VLLLDEPLSALDAHTRGVVRGELQDLLAELALPTLVVTHDFRDAAALAEYIGVVVDGTLRQLGTPEQLVEHPADRFVVSLIGGNLLRGTARPRKGGGSEVLLDDGTVIRSDASATGRVDAAVYPWEMSVHPANGPAGPERNAIGGTITAVSPAEGHLRVRIGAVTAQTSREELDRLRLERGTPARACFSPAAVRLLRRDGE
jgi:ABC-type sulfate/molybdate transport systems ATPase subunit